MALLPMTLSLDIAGDSSEAECVRGGTGVGAGPQAMLRPEQVVVFSYPGPCSSSGIPVTSMSCFSSYISLVFSTWSGFCCSHPIQPMRHPLNIRDPW